MSERPIQLESQLIVGLSRSSDDALVNDSMDDRDVSSMVGSLQIEDN